MSGGNRTVFDISVPVSPDLCVWPGDPPIDVRPASRVSQGDTANVSRVALSSHTGTHVDAPWHFVDDGKRLEEIPPERWNGPCLVIGIDESVKRITPTELDAANIPAGTGKLLFKTANSRLWHSDGPLDFAKDYVALSPEAAQWVVDRGIALVGIDYLSIEPYQEPGHKTHYILLRNEILILEGLNLSAIEPGSYELLCLPLRLTVGDGAPARAVLIRHE